MNWITGAAGYTAILGALALAVAIGAYALALLSVGWPL